jgi:hypothetical protein
MNDNIKTLIKNLKDKSNYELNAANSCTRDNMPNYAAYHVGRCHSLNMVIKEIENIFFIA